MINPFLLLIAYNFVCFPFLLVLVLVIVIVDGCAGGGGDVVSRCLLFFNEMTMRNRVNTAPQRTIKSCLYNRLYSNGLISNRAEKFQYSLLWTMDANTIIEPTIETKFSTNLREKKCRRTATPKFLFKIIFILKLWARDLIYKINYLIYDATLSIRRDFMERLFNFSDWLFVLKNC